jgi:hypothetical protein
MSPSTTKHFWEVDNEVVALSNNRIHYYTEYSIYCGFINTMGLYIHLSYFHPFQQFFIYIDKFYPFFIHYSSNLLTLNNVEKIVWPTVYAILGVVKLVCH